jgi:membrane protein DedA with SNARE-associated domain
VISLGIAAAVVGDNIGYAIGRYGGRGVVEWIARRMGANAQLHRAEEFIERWGALAVFFSRWLVTFLGRWTNLTMGATYFSWPKFLFWDVLGEVLWVFLFVGLGMMFSDRVREVAELTSDVSYAIFGLTLSILMAWLLWRSIRRAGKSVRAA